MSCDGLRLVLTARLQVAEIPEPSAALEGALVAAKQALSNGAPVGGILGDVTDKHVR